MIFLRVPTEEDPDVCYNDVRKIQLASNAEITDATTLSFAGTRKVEVVALPPKK
jgi:hypothetical protein